MKVCNKCNQEKDLSEFSKCRTNKDGHQNMCKACSKSWHYSYRKQNPIHTRDRDKRVRETSKYKKYKEEYYNSKKDEYYSVYLLPKENYVGCTNNVYWRMCNHRSQNRDTSGYIILGRFNDRDEALRLETNYHDRGYAGKHSLNVYARK